MAVVAVEHSSYYAACNKICPNNTMPQMEHGRASTLVAKPEYTIRPLTHKDNPAIKQLFYKVFVPFDYADFAYALSAQSRNHRSSMGLFYKATLIGFGLVCGAPKKAKLWFLCVHPAHRGGGTGTRLLRAILDTIETCYMTPVNDDRIIAWYERMGFRIHSERVSTCHDDPKYVMVYKKGRSRSSSSVDTIEND
jgi:ribosomal protein S18 acetylase RimI-like enzyme